MPNNTTWRTQKSTAIPEKSTVLKLQYSSDWDEFRVAIFVNGVRKEGASYYTTDQADADGTLVHMVKEVENEKPQQA